MDWDAKLEDRPSPEVEESGVDDRDAMLLMMLLTMAR
jgi:hypothetical protein